MQEKPFYISLKNYSAGGQSQSVKVIFPYSYLCFFAFTAYFFPRDAVKERWPVIRQSAQSSLEL